MVTATRPANQPYLMRGDWQERTLDSYLRDAAATSPDKVAVVQGGKRLTYRELAHEVDAVADDLARRGIQQGDVVCVILPNWWEAMVTMQSVLARGAVVNPVVPIYRDHEVEFILRQSDARAVVIPHRFRDFDYVVMMQRLLAVLPHPPTVFVVRPRGPLPDGFVAWRASDSSFDARPARTRLAVLPSDIALLLYTSGTTAAPKGVLHSHQTLDYEDRSIIELMSLTGADTIFMPSPVTHITGFLYGVLMPPMLGATVVFLDVWDPESAYDLIEAERCRFTLAATPFLFGLLELHEARRSSSQLRVFACGGADVPEDLVRRSRYAMRASVVRVYGSSEFPTFSCGRPDDDLSVAATTDGRPIGPVEFRLDGEVDGVGELLVRGPELFLGYLDAELNLAAFTDDGFFKTGDLASVTDEGAIVIRGRSKDIINRGGEKISAHDVESQLFEHPSVREVAVVAMSDPVLGERACAFVVPEVGTEPTLAELTSFLEARHLARQKLPERLILVESLPKTASGKVQKFQLRELLTKPATTANH